MVRILDGLGKGNRRALLVVLRDKELIVINLVIQNYFAIVLPLIDMVLEQIQLKSAVIILTPIKGLIPNILLFGVVLV